MNKDKNGLLFILPAFFGIIIFIIIPIFCSFALSFTDWDMLNNIRFIGFDNYKTILLDKEFVQITLNTIVYAVTTTVFAVIIPLYIADILNTKIRCSELFKTLYFLPFITPTVVIAIVWGWMFDPNIGLVNTLFHTNYTWLFDTKLAMPVLIFVSVWKLIGYNVILFLTGFATIDNSLFEAAKLDGASNTKIFYNITIPLMKNTIFFVTLVTAISSFQVFDLIYIMTSGGPANSTNLLVYSVYKYAFEYFDIGKACALAYILFIIVFSLALLQKKFAKQN